LRRQFVLLLLAWVLFSERHRLRFRWLEEQVLYLLVVVLALRQPQPQALYPQSQKSRQRLLPMRQLRLVMWQRRCHRLVL
jgi:hypothetical protein